MDTAQHTATRLTTNLGAPLQRYILLDGALVNAARIAYQYDDNPWMDWLYRGTRHDDARDVSPVLIQPSADTRLWRDKDAWADHGIVLTSRVAPDELIGHLRSLISIRLPSGQLSYCRFYSGTYLSCLLNAFDSNERSAFSGPVAIWEKPVAHGSWQVFETAGDAESKSLEDEGWFQLKPGHLDRLNQARTDHFLTRLASYLGLDSAPDTSFWLRELVQYASFYGFESEKDIARFTELAVGHQAMLRDRACQAILEDNELPNGVKLIKLDHQLAYGGAG